MFALAVVFVCLCICLLSLLHAPLWFFSFADYVSHKVFDANLYELDVWLDLLRADTVEMFDAAAVLLSKRTYAELDRLKAVCDGLVEAPSKGNISNARPPTHILTNEPMS